MSTRAGSTARHRLGQGRPAGHQIPGLSSTPRWMAVLPCGTRHATTGARKAMWMCKTGRRPMSLRHGRSGTVCAMTKEGLLCNGLIADWAGWQKERGTAFQSLRAVLQALSPSPDEQIEPGELTRISLDDPRDIPTLLMPYGQSVPVMHASAGMRRIIALAYLLVWSWEEHLQASRLLDQQPSSQVLFLIDEIEAHLHPKWQRRIVAALAECDEVAHPRSERSGHHGNAFALGVGVGGDVFDPAQDAWFDLDFERDQYGERVVSRSVTLSGMAMSRTG